MTTYSIDHPRIRNAGLAASRRHPAAPVPDPTLSLLRADRDRLPRWG